MKYDEWCESCKEYDKENHCCPRFNHVIRTTLDDVRKEAYKHGKSKGIKKGLAMAQPKRTEERTKRHACDSISREEATSIPILPKEHRKIFKSIDDAFETGWNEALSCVNMLPSAQPEQRWIPCDETVEIPDHEVLACDKYGEEILGYLGYADDQWICESDSEVMYDPIAWMEKPEPYKGEQE